MSATVRFQPLDGAYLDLDSLRAIPAETDRLVAAWLATRAPRASSLIIDGLELAGELSASGPPGTRRPDPQAPGVVVSPGRALVEDAQGRRFVLVVDQELRAAWPTSAGLAVAAQLVLRPQIEGAEAAAELPVARDRVVAQVGFLKLDQPEQAHLIPLARALGNGRDWVTDLGRIWQPDHPSVRLLLRKLDQIDNTIWKAEPEGAVWDRQVLGRNWARYQTTAASSLHAARMELEVHALSTAERVRLLCGLKAILARSVERAATELTQLAGGDEVPGPYRALLVAPGA